MRELSEKQGKAIRFVLGPILIVAGLTLWNYMIGDDMVRMMAEAFQAEQPPHIDFAFMLKGIAPLAVALIGFKLITWKALTAKRN